MVLIRVKLEMFETNSIRRILCFSQLIPHHQKYTSFKHVFGDADFLDISL